MQTSTVLDRSSEKSFDIDRASAFSAEAPYPLRRSICGNANAAASSSSPEPGIQRMERDVVQPFAILAVSGASMIALPSFAPKAEANEGLALAKSDRFAVRSPPQNCFKQTWPDFATACLRNSGSEAKIVKARLVTARR